MREQFFPGSLETTMDTVDRVIGADIEAAEKNVEGAVDKAVNGAEKLAHAEYEAVHKAVHEAEERRKLERVEADTMLRLTAV